MLLNKERILAEKECIERESCEGCPRNNSSTCLATITPDLIETALHYMSKFTVPIVCLCGSTRFYKAFSDWLYRFTLDGLIVLSIGCNTKSDDGLKLTAEDKTKLDELHKRKIDLCDWVFVLDVNGYIGDSTRSEIEYAEKHGKPVKYLSKEFPDYKEPIDELKAKCERQAKVLEMAKEALVSSHDVLTALNGTVYRNTALEGENKQAITAIEELISHE